MRKIAILSLLVCLPSLTLASEEIQIQHNHSLSSRERKYLTLGKPKISISNETASVESLNDLAEIQTQSVPPAILPQTGGGIEIKIGPQTEPTAGVGGLGLIDIINKVWDIVQKGRPVVNAANLFASALPKVSAGDWLALSGWKSIRSFKVNVVYPNGFGMKVVDFSYWVRLIYGGNYNGKGLFIASAQISPAEIKVVNQYNLDMKVSAPAIFNMGAVDNPLAAIQMDVTWDIKTFAMHYSKTNSYTLQGDGLIRDNNTANEIYEANPSLQGHP